MKKLALLLFLVTLSGTALAQNYERHQFEVMGVSENCPKAQSAYAGCAKVKLIPSNKIVKIYAGKTRAMTNALVRTLTGLAPGIIKIKASQDSIILNNKTPLSITSISQGDRKLYEQNIYDIVESQCEQTRGTIESAFAVLGIVEDECSKRQDHVVDTGRREVREVDTRYGESPRIKGSVYIDGRR